MWHTNFYCTRSKLRRYNGTLMRTCTRLHVPYLTYFTVTRSTLNGMYVTHFIALVPTFTGVLLYNALPETYLRWHVRCIAKVYMCPCRHVSSSTLFHCTRIHFHTYSTPSLFGVHVLMLTRVILCAFSLYTCTLWNVYCALWNLWYITHFIVNVLTSTDVVIQKRLL